MDLYSLLIPERLIITMQASVSALKARLSQYLDAVKAGDEVLVTDRGVAVAKLSPVVGAAEMTSRMDLLVRTGRIRRPDKDVPTGFWDLPRPTDPDGRSLSVLLEERDEGR